MALLKQRQAELTLRRGFALPERGTWVGLGLAILVGMLTITPVGFVVFGSFDITAPGQPLRLGLDGWRQVLSESRATLSAIGYSFLLAIRAPFAVLVGFALAWLIVRARIPGARWIELGLWVAFFLPALPVALGWILLLDPNYGAINGALRALPFVTGSPFNIFSVGGILWVHLTTSTIPIMVILLLPALRRFDAALEDSARSCGASGLRIMRTITLPILAPAVLTALLAGFIRSLEAFEIEQLLGTPAGIQVFSTRVFEYIRFQPAQFPPALALSTFFLLVLFVLAFAYQWYTNEHRYASVTGRGVSFRPMPRERWHYIASAICFAMIFISVVIPMVMLVTGSLMRGFGFFNVPNPYTTLHWERVLRDPVFLRSISASLQLGFAASLGGLVLYSLLAYAIVRSRIWGRNVISLLSWLPWALPGLLLGLSLLWMILNVPGLNLLYGTVGGLVFALLVKDLPLGTQMMKTAFIQVAEELEQASRVCGAGWLRTFRAIMLPLVIPMMTSVFVWSFISSLRDISTVILLSSPSARPLSVLMMEFSISGNLEAATVVATIISATALAVALAVRRLGLRFGSELG